MEKQSRKISTIIFADVVGYTAMMQADESQAIRFLDKFKKTLERETSVFEGRIVQFFGDGCLLSFESTSQAVECAMGLQRDFWGETMLPVRIGVHLGEVVYQHENVFGDGVNLASRIESLGVPGSVLISRAVRDQIKNKPAFQLKSLGKFDFKNVEESMEVFALTNDSLVVPHRRDLSGKTKKKKFFSLPVDEYPISTKLFRNLTIYLLAAWVLIESFAFAVKKWDLDWEFVNLLIILVAFGIPATIIFSLVKGRFNWKAIVLQTVNVIAGFISLIFYVIHPNVFDPSGLRLIKLTSQAVSPLNSLSSLAILPFANLLNDDSQEYQLAGMHDGLILEIGKLGDIRVISRTSTLPYSDTKAGLSEIGKELDVEAIMEGTLTRVDSLVNLRLKLFSLNPREKNLWSNEYSTKFEELPNLYRKVTQNVAQELLPLISPKQLQQLETNQQVNSEAYREFMRGNYLIGNLSPESIEKAEGHFKMSIEIDSNFATSYAGLALIWLAKNQMEMVYPDSAGPISWRYLEKALSIDQDNEFVWMVAASYHLTVSYDWQASEQAFRKSIEINPNFSGSRYTYAHLLMIMNRWDEAWEQMRYAMTLDPNNPWVIAFSAVLYSASGKILTALKRMDELSKIAPNHMMAIATSMQKHLLIRQHDQAIEDFKKIIAQAGINGLQVFIDTTYQKFGFQETVRKTTEKLELRSESEFISPALLLRFYGLLEDREKFISCVEKMYEINDPDLGYLGIRPKGRKGLFQDDPRYITIMKEIGLW